MRHTQGPWRNQNDVIIFGKDSNDAVAKICIGVSSRQNARLIAAAPELLECLKELISLTDRKHDFWDKAKAVIAKAEGQS
jgi:hypothetical protein